MPVCGCHGENSCENSSGALQTCDRPHVVADLSPKTCTCLGDPHCTSFDGRHFDYQGHCAYKLVGYSGPANGITHPFDVSRKAKFVKNNLKDFI